MIVIAGKNDIAVHGLLLATEHFDLDQIIVIANKNDQGLDSWQRSLLRAAKHIGVRVKTLAEVYELNISHFISLEFDQIIKPENLSTDKVYNIHFSELPKYKGMYTSVWPILYGDTQSGVTLHKIDSGIDTGDIIAQEIFELAISDRSQDCYKKYIESSKSLLSKWFVKIISDDIEPSKQSSINSTYFSKKAIDYSNLSIDFNQTAWQIKRQVYAFSFRPYQLLKINQRSISDIVIKDSMSTLKPGTVIGQNDIFLTLSTIDYDIEAYFDGLEHFLTMIPTMAFEDLDNELAKILGVNDRNDKGWSPIIVAAYYGRKDLITSLITKGADINDRNYRGTTVLMYGKDYALKNSDINFFNFLIDLGADLSLKDWSGRDLSDYITNEQAKLLGV